MKRCTSRLKPMLTDKHKSDRMAFVQRHLRTGASGKRYWHDMLDTVHIDEKWFYVTKQNRRYYLWSDEAVPTRKCRSKKHITKVMFLTAVARPRYDARNKRMWDGRIGMWPFVKTRPALRSSKNRKRGDDVTEPFTVTRDVYRSFLIDKVIPAVRSKWPSSKKNQIWIQQDNAKPHVSVNDPAVVAAGRQGGWTISLCSQPAQSPDLNVLDLGYFNAIQSLQHQMATYTLDDLVVAVVKSFEELECTVLDKTFMTLQKVMECIFKMGGDNDFKLPHQKKHGLVKEGPLPTRLECDEDVCAAVDAMEERSEFEGRVDVLSDLLDNGCQVQGEVDLSNVDSICSRLVGVDLDGDE
ncbi:hypothetical protein AaE_013731 [Aphanomyces astaci]|uniref:Tc1-like transposase DDE domain-containing protein n=1 Tax=Aphanomyces astaci TaxID=112090 RepID=A0A6A4Z9D8_APHAT|nr:hypothetical protein AaE_013731 [Aphanomyces astaci]